MMPTLDTRSGFPPLTRLPPDAVFLCNARERHSGKAVSNRANLTALKTYSPHSDYRFDTKTFTELKNLRQVFCTRVSGVAPDAVVQRVMRHISPETKRQYKLGMADQVRQAMEKSNKKARPITTFCSDLENAVRTREQRVIRSGERL